jgi:hypothetical protein
MIRNNGSHSLYVVKESPYGHVAGRIVEEKSTCKFQFQSLWCIEDAEEVMKMWNVESGLCQEKDWQILL